MTLWPRFEAVSAARKAFRGEWSKFTAHERTRLIWKLADELEANLALAPEFGKADREHFSALLRGVIRDLDMLHEAIAPHLDRTVAELSPVEHATLLVGAFELARHAEIPYRVVINEAVELAKTFGGTDGFKYVNGVLDRVAAELRATEVAARRR